MSFPLFLDENIDVELAALLHDGGYDVLTTRQVGRANQRIGDEDQLAFAATQGRAIVTHNVKDFVPLATAWSEQSKHHAGIVVSEFRPPGALYSGLLLIFEWYPGGIADYILRVPTGE